MLYRESGLEIYSVAIRIGRFPVQTLLGAWPGLDIQPRYEAPGDLPVEIVESAMINVGLARLSP